MVSKSTKWYRKNEAEVMKNLGLKPTSNSGSGWIEKADGQNDDVICELKTTDANSYRLNLQDLQKVEHHGMVSHKVPVFAVQFTKSEEVYLVLKPEDLMDLAEGLKNGEFNKRFDDEVVDVVDVKTDNPKRKIKSSRGSREQFFTEQNERYRKEKKAW